MRVCIFVLLLLFTVTPALEIDLAVKIEAWLNEEGLEPLTYDDEPNTWYISTTGDNMGVVPCTLYLSYGFICFQSVLVSIPEHSHGDLCALADVLLRVGLENYLVKVVINDYNNVELEAEFPAADLSRDDFVTALWLVLNTADAEYPRIIEHVYR
ncbi:hypothetical protein KAU45_06195 [bacterium]|nr:hypothetical protein [bacterium]